MYNCALYSQSRIKKDAPMLTLPVHWVTVLKLIPFFYLRLSLSTTWRNMRRLILLSFFLFFGSSSSSDDGEMTDSSDCLATDREDQGRDISVLTVGSEIFISSFLRSALCISLHWPEWVSALHLHRHWWWIWREVVRHPDRSGTFRHRMGSLQSGMWGQCRRSFWQCRRSDKYKYQQNELYFLTNPL